MVPPGTRQVPWAWDRRAHASEAKPDLKRDFYEVRPLRLAGKESFVMLAGVLGAVAFLGAPWRELAIVLLSMASYARTDPALREANRFTFHPILEVAALFVGIFVTMLPAIDLLRAQGAELGVREPWQFFWATGALSSFLDNAPTYVTFFAFGQGLGPPADVVGVPHALWWRSASGRCSWGRTPTSATARTSWSARSPSSAGSRCRASAATCSTARACSCRCSCW